MSIQQLLASKNNAPIKIDTSMTSMIGGAMCKGPAPKSPQDSYSSVYSAQYMTPTKHCRGSKANSPWGTPNSPVSPSPSPTPSITVSNTSPKSVFSNSASLNSPRSPVSTISKTGSAFTTPQKLHAQQKRKAAAYSPTHTMQKKGYAPAKCLGSTLQGSIWKTKRNKGAKSSVIKVTSKSLHAKSVAMVNGSEVSICEDVIKETAILRYLSSNQPPKSLAKFESFFSDGRNYFLVVEDGGSGMFEFVAKCHKFISAGRLDIAEWHRFCKLAFQQIVQLVDWMHNQMHCAHLDISLENMVIDDVMVQVQEQSNKIVFSDSFSVKMVDFGLAEVFTARDANGEVDFGCAKYVGKTAYKCPTIYAKKGTFDARAADCWSLGVALFMMAIGGAPYKKPCAKDASFTYIMRGKMVELLDEWDRLDFVTPKLVDLLARIFRREQHRIDIDEIKKHPWLL